MTDRPPPEKQVPPPRCEMRCPRCQRPLGERSGGHFFTEALRVLRMRAACRGCGFVWFWPGRGVPRPPEGRDA